MSERAPSRLDAARDRAASVKRALAVTSAAAFCVAVVWAHSSHPGAAAVQDGGAGFSFGSGSLSPSTGRPDTGTHVS